jgi:PII-like signaling protein
LAGATLLKGVARFGRDREIHTTAIEVVARDSPIVVEVVVS